MDIKALKINEKLSLKESCFFKFYVHIYYLNWLSSFYGVESSINLTQLSSKLLLIIRIRICCYPKF